MKSLYFIICSFNLVLNAQNNYPLLKLSKPTSDACHEKNTSIQNVRGKYFTNCTFDNDFFMYPVLVENFDYKEDLPNNWNFNLNWSLDDFADKLPQSKISGGSTWMGYPEGGFNNVFVNNSVCELRWEQENVSNKAARGDALNKNYNFTGAMLYSIFKLKQGVFEARVKLPENPNFWPAYWLYDAPQEIDIFEFYEGYGINAYQNANCDKYHQMKMTLHYTWSDETKCQRGRKFPVHNKTRPNDNKPDFFDDYHLFKCVWTDYRVDIYLDGERVGYATKYYDGPYTPTNGCERNGDDKIPLYTRDCNYINNTNVCNAYYPWPFNNRCMIKNRVDMDEGFPKTDWPLSLIIGNAINYKIERFDVNQALIDSWNNFAPKDKSVFIDYIKIYQPVKCETDRYICSLSDFLDITGKTNFLSGRKITVSPYNNCFFANQPINNVGGNVWRELPLHFLASEEIAFLPGDGVEILEGAFLRAEIIDCSGGFNQYQRGALGEPPLFLSDEEHAAIEQRYNDSLLANDPDLKAEVEKYNKENQLIEKSSSTDFGAITVFPNPTTDNLFIDIDEEGFNDLMTIEIINSLGVKTTVAKSTVIDVKNLTLGLYQIKFIFNHGFIIVKGFVKH